MNNVLLYFLSALIFQQQIQLKNTTRLVSDKNIIHNFLVHHSANKHLLLHKRNLFFHILSNIGRHIFEEPEDFIEYCTQYCDETSNYYDEMCITIYTNFSGNFYPYKLETIADAIGFTQEDIKNSFCSFSREEREARHLP